jgi:hypothetical protein
MTGEFITAEDGEEGTGGITLANKLAQEIEKILSDAVGDFIARATVKKNCELIGTTPDTITADKLPELADKIDKSVSFFSGKDVGSALAEKIRAIKA